MGTNCITHSAVSYLNIIYDSSHLSNDLRLLECAVRIHVCCKPAFVRLACASFSTRETHLASRGRAGRYRPFDLPFFSFAALLASTDEALARTALAPTNFKLLGDTRRRQQ